MWIIIDFHIDFNNKILKLFENSLKYEKGVFGLINSDNKILKLFANSLMNKTCYNYGTFLHSVNNDTNRLQKTHIRI